MFSFPPYRLEQQPLLGLRQNEESPARSCIQLRKETICFGILTVLGIAMAALALIGQIFIVNNSSLNDWNVEHHKDRDTLLTIMIVVCGAVLSLASLGFLIHSSKKEESDDSQIA